jgi:serine/threonine-protein kinase
MATVYLAEDLRHGRKVAVKVLLPELAAVLGAERFLSEIHVTAGLQHPHILPLFDSGQVEGQLFYVMPYVEGESLRSRLDRERQLPIDDALRIAHEVASALGYAHRHGVIHRDIKPENILLHDGHAVVADFGIALAVTSAGGGRLTQTGLSLGTPQYMSPEQATGEREIDARSDLYSLAAVTYEMLAGETPHTGNTMQAVIARMLTERPRNVRSLRPSVPEEVAAALDTALERIPADRWHSIEEFERALDGRIMQVTKSGGVRQTMLRKPVAVGWRARLKDPVILALASVAIVASAIAAISLLRRPALQEEPTARFLLTLPRGTRLSAGTQNVFAMSPDGKLIVFRGRDSTARDRLFLRRLDETRVTPLPGTEGSFSVWFSPDSRWIGFIGTQGIRKMLVSTRDIVNVGTVKGIYGGSDWTPGGDLIISMNSGRLFVIPENGGPERKLCGPSGDAMLAQVEPLVLADGDHVLFGGAMNTSFSGSRLGVASLSTGECTLFDVPAIDPVGVANGIVTFATSGGVIMGARFNERSNKVEGNAVPLISDVDINQTTGAAQASMSRTGTLLYLNSSAQTEIVKVDLAGHTQPILAEQRVYAYPRYSPDGRRIAVAVATSAQRDIWLIDAGSGTVSRLTSGGFINDRPEWSPDGKRVLYRTARGARSSIWWRAADMSDNESPLISDEHDDYYEAVLSPDGKSIIYQQDTAGSNVMMQSLSASAKPVPLAASEYLESMPRVSPDGKWLAYVLDVSSAEEVFVQPYPGPGARVQVSSGGGSEPVWSRNGQKLFYRDDQNVTAVSFRTTSGFEVTGRQIVFPDLFVKRSLPHANYDVSPDGSSFLFLKPTSDNEAVVVHNWMSEVRARLSEAEKK